jgi:hypothetical protein
MQRAVARMRERSAKAHAWSGPDRRGIEPLAVGSEREVVDPSLTLHGKDFTMSSS